jgi:NADH dehydrogenase [ubiquinone] 1 alpha subcomplex assembly factor 6
MASEEYSKEQMRQDHAHCVSLVRERDKEGYRKYLLFCLPTLTVSQLFLKVCGLLMPSPRAYFALKAFNAEIAAIKDGHRSQQRSEGASLAMQMRFQWWMDAIDQVIYGDADNNNSYSHSPVIRSLKHAHQEFDFTRRFIERLIESRRADLDVVQYSTMDDLIRYAEDSVSTMLYLSLETLGVREDAVDEVAYHAGVGIGLVTAIRSIPYNLRVHENLSVPSDVLRTESSRQRDDLILSLLAEEDSPIAPLTEEQKQLWQDAVQEMAAVASWHLSRAQQLQIQVPRNARVAFLPVVPSMLYLSQLQGPAQYNVFDPTLNDPSQRRLRLLLLLSRTWLTGVF